MSEEITSVMSKKKASKPVMERKRRARINHSLNELKVLILDITKKQASSHSKLEKAAILEMTVQHLRNRRTEHQIINNTQSPDPLANYRAGFNECAGEITRYLASLDDVGVNWKTRLLEHLATCCHASAVPKPPLAVPCLPSMPRSVSPSPAPSVLSFLQRKQDDPGIELLTDGTLKIATIFVPTESPFLMTASQPSGHQDLTHVLCKDPMETSSPGGIPKEPGNPGTDSTLWRPF